MHDDLRHHIVGAFRPTSPEGRVFSARLAGRCWPGGGVDEFCAPAARWLASWGPGSNDLRAPECGCAGGHCAICN